MSEQNVDLFETLLRAKSYLLGILDNPANGKSFYFTEEFLDRIFPEKREEVIDLLKQSGIHCDSDIAFDDSVQSKFKEIASKDINIVDLRELLKKYEIELLNPEQREKEIKKIMTEREEKLQIIISLLIKLAKYWGMHHEIEHKVDDYSNLIEEDMIRPQEEKNVDEISKTTSISFELISELTNKYIEQLTDYYFKYGGDVSLKEFVKNLDILKNNVSKKYSDLFKQHGLDPNML